MSRTIAPALRIPNTKLSRLLERPNFLFDVSAGNIRGASLNLIIGQTLTAGMTRGTVWDAGGDWTTPSAASTFYIASTDASDTAITVVVTGLDGSYVQQTATVTVSSGQTPVDIGSWLYVAVARVAGSNNPAGDIWIASANNFTNGVPDNQSEIQAKIPQDDLVSHNGFHIVPAGYSTYLLRANLNVRKNKDAQFQGRVRFPGTDVFINRNPVAVYEASVPFDFITPLPLPAQTVLRADVESSANNTEANIIYFTVLVDESILGTL